MTCPDEPKSSMCIVDGEVFRNGDPVPTDDHCEKCTCRPPGFSCVLRDCDVKPGCKAVRRDGECCPEYLCGCVHGGNIYEDGELIRDIQNPCYTCRCHGSSISCVFADCLFRGDCAPEYVNGECCPKYDHCPTLSTTAASTIFTTPSTTIAVYDDLKEVFFNLTTLHLEKFTEGDFVKIDTVNTLHSETTTPEISSSTPSSTDKKFSVTFSLLDVSNTDVSEGLFSSISTWLSQKPGPIETTTLSASSSSFESSNGDIVQSENGIASTIDDSSKETFSTSSEQLITNLLSNGDQSETSIIPTDESLQTDRTMSSFEDTIQLQTKSSVSDMLDVEISSTEESLRSEQVSNIATKLGEIETDINAFTVTSTSPYDLSTSSKKEIPDTVLEEQTSLPVSITQLYDSTVLPKASSESPIEHSEIDDSIESFTTISTFATHVNTDTVSEIEKDFSIPVTEKTQPDDSEYESSLALQSITTTNIHNEMNALVHESESDDLTSTSMKEPTSESEIDTGVNYTSPPVDSLNPELQGKVSTAQDISSSYISTTPDSLFVYKTTLRDSSLGEVDSTPEYEETIIVTTSTLSEGTEQSENNNVMQSETYSSDLSIDSSMPKIATSASETNKHVALEESVTPREVFTSSEIFTSHDLIQSTNFELKSGNDATNDIENPDSGEASEEFAITGTSFNTMVTDQSTDKTATSVKIDTFEASLKKKDEVIKLASHPEDNLIIIFDSDRSSTASAESHVFSETVSDISYESVTHSSSIISVNEAKIIPAVKHDFDTSSTYSSNEPSKETFPQRLNEFGINSETPILPTTESTKTTILNDLVGVETFEKISSAVVLNLDNDTIKEDERVTERTIPEIDKESTYANEHFHETNNVLLDSIQLNGDSSRNAPTTTYNVLSSTDKDTMHSEHIRNKDFTTTFPSTHYPSTVRPDHTETNVKFQSDYNTVSESENLVTSQNEGTSTIVPSDKEFYNEIIAVIPDLHHDDNMDIQNTKLPVEKSPETISVGSSSTETALSSEELFSIRPVESLESLDRGSISTKYERHTSTDNSGYIDTSTAEIQEVSVKQEEYKTSTISHVSSLLLENAHDVLDSEKISIDLHAENSSFTTSSSTTTELKFQEKHNTDQKDDIATTEESVLDHPKLNRTNFLIIEHMDFPPIDSDIESLLQNDKADSITNVQVDRVSSEIPILDTNKSDEPFAKDTETTAYAAESNTDHKSTILSVTSLPSKHEDGSDDILFLEEGQLHPVTITTVNVIKPEVIQSNEESNAQSSDDIKKTSNNGITLSDTQLGDDEGKIPTNEHIPYDDIQETMMSEINTFYNEKVSTDQMYFTESDATETKGGITTSLHSDDNDVAETTIVKNESLEPLDVGVKTTVDSADSLKKLILHDSANHENFKNTLLTTASLPFDDRISINVEESGEITTIDYAKLLNTVSIGSDTVTGETISAEKVSKSKIDTAGTFPDERLTTEGISETQTSQDDDVTDEFKPMENQPSQTTHISDFLKQFTGDGIPLSALLELWTLTFAPSEYTTTTEKLNVEETSSSEDPMKVGLSTQNEMTTINFNEPLSNSNNVDLPLNDKTTDKEFSHSNSEELLVGTEFPPLSENSPSSTNNAYVAETTTADEPLEYKISVVSSDKNANEELFNVPNVHNTPPLKTTIVTTIYPSQSSVSSKDKVEDEVVTDISSESDTHQFDSSKQSTSNELDSKIVFNVDNREEFPASTVSNAPSTSDEFFTIHEKNENTIEYKIDNDIISSDQIITSLSDETESEFLRSTTEFQQTPPNFSETDNTPEESKPSTMFSASSVPYPVNAKRYIDVDDETTFLQGVPKVWFGYENHHNSKLTRNKPTLMNADLDDLNEKLTSLSKVDKDLISDETSNDKAPSSDKSDEKESGLTDSQTFTSSVIDMKEDFTDAPTKKIFNGNELSINASNISTEEQKVTTLDPIVFKSDQEDRVFTTEETLTSEKGVTFKPTTETTILSSTTEQTANPHSMSLNPDVHAEESVIDVLVESINPSEIITTLSEDSTYLPTSASSNVTKQQTLPPLPLLLSGIKGHDSKTYTTSPPSKTTYSSLSNLTSRTETDEPNNIKDLPIPSLVHGSIKNIVANMDIKETAPVHKDDETTVSNLNAQSTILPVSTHSTIKDETIQNVGGRVPNDIPLVEGYRIKSGDFVSITSSYIIVEDKTTKDDMFNNPTRHYVEDGKHPTKRRLDFENADPKEELVEAVTKSIDRELTTSSFPEILLNTNSTNIALISELSSTSLAVNQTDIPISSETLNTLSHVTERESEDSTIQHEKDSTILISTAKDSTISASTVKDFSTIEPTSYDTSQISITQEQQASDAKTTEHSRNENLTR